MGDDEDSAWSPECIRVGTHYSFADVAAHLRATIGSPIANLALPFSRLTSEGRGALRPEWPTAGGPAYGGVPRTKWQTVARPPRGAHPPAGSAASGSDFGGRAWEAPRPLARFGVLVQIVLQFESANSHLFEFIGLYRSTLR